MVAGITPRKSPGVSVAVNAKAGRDRLCAITASGDNMTVTQLIQLLKKMEPGEEVFFEDDRGMLHPVASGLMERLINDDGVLIAPLSEDEMNSAPRTKEVVVLR
jgi:hypothetical protein